MKEITHEKAIMWRDNSLALAIELGYDGQVLDKIVADIPIKISEGFPGKLHWMYGWAWYGPGRPYIGIQPWNFSSLEENARYIGLNVSLPFLKVPEEKRTRIIEVFKSIPREDFYKIFNQSGMDHEAIGHMYHFLAGEAHGEKEAIGVQIQFAEARTHIPYWTEALEILPDLMENWEKVDLNSPPQTQ